MRMPNGFGNISKLSGKRRKPYMARVSPDKNTRIVLGYFATKNEALNALTEYNKNPYAVLDASMTVKALWDDIKDKVKASDNRKTVYQRTFEKYMSPIADMKIKDVKAKHLQQLIDDCEMGYSVQSNIRTVCKHIFKFAAQNDIIDKDYSQFIEVDPEATQIERVLFTKEEIDKLWERKDIEEYATCLILLHQGMRIKELRDCTKDWIDLDKKTIDIQIAKNNYSIRVVPINEKVFPLIKMLYDRSPDNQLIHVKKNGYEYFVKNVLNHTPYDTRHTFASKANELGIQTVKIQRLMGHKPETILEQTYIHLSMEELSDAINQVVY